MNKYYETLRHWRERARTLSFCVDIDGVRAAVHRSPFIVHIRSYAFCTDQTLPM